MGFESRRSGRYILALALVLGLATAASPSACAQTFGTVYSFTGKVGGANPVSGLVVDNGNLYGTARAHGASGAGVVYEINGTTGAESVIYNFKGGADGADPEASLLLLGGNLYGTTLSGGGKANAGTVFEVTPAGQETVLYRFTGEADGAAPQAALTADSSGNLYGTTSSGGARREGAVFELIAPTVAGGAWTEQVLYSFDGSPDGAGPVAGVTFDAAGNLYGTTSAGGTYGYGTVFQLVGSASGWTENILHEFELASDGGVPYAGISIDSLGNLYGAATEGGEGGTNGGGTVFELTPSSGGWTFEVIYALKGWKISGSYRNLLLLSGNIYATTHCDGAPGAGTVYELNPSGDTWNYTSLQVFAGGSGGLYSISSPVLFNGELWGTTQLGGAYGFGTVWAVTP